MTVTLSTAYFPPIEWLSYVVQSGNWALEAHEHFQKQSFRSRTHIHGPNGVQFLSVPIDRSIKDITRTKISYSENWVKDHLKAIETAYANAPYFEVLFEDVSTLLYQKYATLWELNTATIALFMEWMELPEHFVTTASFQTTPSTIDARAIHPKLSTSVILPEYHQVFKHKNGFAHNLSGLDLFFNLGRGSWDYLHELKLQAQINTDSVNEPIL